MISSKDFRKATDASHPTGSRGLERTCPVGMAKLTRAPLFLETEDGSRGTLLQEAGRVGGGWADRWRGDELRGRCLGR